MRARKRSFGCSPSSPGEAPTKVGPRGALAHAPNRACPTPDNMKDASPWRLRLATVFQCATCTARLRSSSSVGLRLTDELAGVNRLTLFPPKPTFRTVRTSASTHNLLNLHDCMAGSKFA